MTSFKIAARTVLLLLSLSLSLAALGDATKAANSITLDDPVKMVEQTTDRVLKLAQEARANSDDDPQAYHQQVEAVLERVVDVHYFARGVMGNYASARLYKALETEEERQAFKARVDQFSESLKDSFIATYADALLAFDSVKVELQKPGPQQEADEMSLTQTLYNESNQPYKVQYRLHKNREGQWQVYNVIVEGVNMGATYRSQFAQAVEDNSGNVDFVVNNWQQIMKDPQGLAQAKDE